MSKKKVDDDITFVVTSNPLESSAANKRRVRSVAALRSWPERRKKTFETLQGGQGGFVLDLPEPAGQKSEHDALRQRRHGPKTASPDIADASESRSTKTLKRQRSGSDEEPLFETCMRAVSDSCACSHCDSEKRYLKHERPAVIRKSRKRTVDVQLKSIETKDQAVMLTPPLSPNPSTALNITGRAEPFNQYPVPYQPFFDYVMHHLMNVFVPRGWPALKITNAEGRQWERFITQHALSEPALFYVRLLFASGDLIRLKVLQPEVSYWLQDQAVQSLNDALSEPSRATSDALIIAVGRIALHENLYGDRQAANNVHRPAQKRMIDMRGGMKGLPYPELIKRLMRWGDTIMSKQSGTQRLLEDDTDNENYNMDQHVDALESWVPSQGQELRKTIKISDLLAPELPTPP